MQIRQNSTNRLCNSTKFGKKSYVRHTIFEKLPFFQKARAFASTRPVLPHMRKTDNQKPYSKQTAHSPPTKQKRRATAAVLVKTKVTPKVLLA